MVLTVLNRAVFSAIAAPCCPAGQQLRARAVELDAAYSPLQNSCSLSVRLLPCSDVYHAVPSPAPVVSKLPYASGSVSGVISRHTVSQHVLRPHPSQVSFAQIISVQVDSAELTIQYLPNDCNGNGNNFLNFTLALGSPQVWQQLESQNHLNSGMLCASAVRLHATRNVRWLHC